MGMWARKEKEEEEEEEEEGKDVGLGPLERRLWCSVSPSKRTANASGSSPSMGETFWYSRGDWDDGLPLRDGGTRAAHRRYSDVSGRVDV